MSNLSDKDIQEIRKAMGIELSDRPPSIGLVGVSGVGKSSTINAMFKTSLAISHTVACTKEFKATDMSLQIKQGEMSGNKVSLKVIDAPGLGEDKDLDPKYIKMYREHLPDCDVILWILSARNRAMALDQSYLEKLNQFREKIVFGINQVDLVHPMDWNRKINLPSIAMEKNIEEIVKDRKEKLFTIVKTNIKIIPYSASYGFNLHKLFDMVIEAIPENRRWIFGGLKNFSYRDFIPLELQKGEYSHE